MTLIYTAALETWQRKAKSYINYSSLDHFISVRFSLIFKIRMLICENWLKYSIWS